METHTPDVRGHDRCRGTRAAEFGTPSTEIPPWNARELELLVDCATDAAPRVVSRVIGASLAPADLVGEFVVRALSRGRSLFATAPGTVSVHPWIRGILRNVARELRAVECRQHPDVIRLAARAAASRRRRAARRRARVAGLAAPLGQGRSCRVLELWLSGWLSADIADATGTRRESVQRTVNRALTCAARANPRERTCAVRPAAPGLPVPAAVMDRDLMLLRLSKEGRTPSEIAGILGISANAARVRLHRLRRSLALGPPGPVP